MPKLSMLMPLAALFCFGCRQQLAPASGGSSAAASSITLPAPVGEIVRGYTAQCTRLGGTMTGPAQPLTLTADLDADGKPDYVFNPANLQCSESASLFCPNGGCQISIALSRDGYKNPITLLGGRPVLTDTPEGKSLEVQVQGFNCDGANRRDTCLATYRWQEGKLNPQYHIR